MGAKEFLILIALVICLHGIQCQEPCILHMMDYSKTPVFRPFIYKTDGTLYPTRNNEIKIPHSQEVYFSCETNFFKQYSNLHNLTVKCNDDTLVVSHDNSKNPFKNLNCDIRVMEEVKHNVIGCPETGGGLYYQYYSNKIAAYIIMSEVCFDYSQEQVKFIRFQLPHEVAKTHTENIPDSFDKISHKLSILSAYRVDAVAKLIQSLLTDNFMMADESIVAVKLLPKFFFNEQLQDIERFPTNVIGLWKTVARGNWNNLLNDINDYGKDRKKPLEVILGTHGTLELARPDGIDVKLLLKDDKVPIPNFVWAVVHDKEKNQAVSIVIINNPFGRYEEFQKQVMCRVSKCKEITWLKRLTKTNNHERPIHGYTFCCEMEAFKLYPGLSMKTLLKN